MASEKLNMVPTHQIHKHPQLVFPEALSCVPPHHHIRVAAVEQGPKTTSRELTVSFLDNQPQYFHAPQRQPAEFRHHWNDNNRDSVGNDSGDEDEDDEDRNLTNIVTVAEIGDSNRGGRCIKKPNDDSLRMKRVSALVVENNEGNSDHSANNEIFNCGDVRNASIGEILYRPYLNGRDGQSSSSGRKDSVDIDNGCKFSGRKEYSYSSEPGYPLSAILSDPITGKLMDDAMILPCGHSFGSGGIEQVSRVKACCTCSKPVSEDAITPNLSLRLAVQAFRREEKFLFNRTLKRKRERYDRDLVNYGDSMLNDHLRGSGIQFPFSLTDRVIIKGNKRTPQRFVGREAIVTAQCLNGWYVVKTLDNSESVKLQYRSLARINDNTSSTSLPVKMITN